MLRAFKREIGQSVVDKIDRRAIQEQPTGFVLKLARICDLCLESMPVKESQSAVLAALPKSST
jgi:hypothetical protein